MSKRNKKLLTPFKELDSLTELFSFFTTFDTRVSRQVCKWWNDLLLKDSLTIKQLEKNWKDYFSNMIVEYNLPWSSYFGYLEIVKWYRKNGGRWKENRCCDFSARGNQLKALKWLRKNGANWNRTCCENAASNDNLKMLKWLRKNGCDWSPYVCENAATRGYLEILKYATGEGCPWIWGMIVGVCKNGHLNVLKWMIENYRITEFGNNACQESKKHPHIYSYLHSLPFEKRICGCHIENVP
jgi:hypothetical protein